MSRLSFRAQATVGIGGLVALVLVAALALAQSTWALRAAREEAWIARTARLAELLELSARLGEPGFQAALERLAPRLEGEAERALAAGLAEDGRLQAAGGPAAEAARARLRAGFAELGESLGARLEEQGRLSRAETDRARVSLFGLAGAALLAALGLGALLARRLSRLHRRALESGAQAEFERGRLERMLQGLPVPLVRTRGPEHVIEFASSQLLALWGPEATGRRLVEVHPELCEAWDRVLRGGESLPELRACRHGGTAEAVHLSLWLEPVRDPRGEIEGVLGLATDVSDLVEACASAERLQALAASLARSLTAGEVAQVIVEQCRLAFGGSAGLLATLTGDGLALRVAGPPGAVAGASPPQLVLGLESELPICEAAREARLVVVASGAGADGPCRALPGWERTRTEAFLPLCHDGRTLGVVGIACEQERSFGQTERSLMLTTGRLCAQALERASLYEAEKSARALAEAAVQARDEFLSIASHELKTPLTVLQLQLGRAARRGERLGAEGASEVAERSVARLTRLAHNLVDVSQVGADRLLLEIERVDLGEAVREVAERFEAELAHSGSRLELQVEGELVGLWDRLRVEQIASNLLSNAVKFGGGRPIRVEAVRQAEFARLTVRDGGLGIAPEDRERIFRRLERAVSARHYGGLGLGLWLTRCSVEALGGTVEVDSEPGVSSTFVVRLPIGGPAAALGAGSAGWVEAEVPGRAGGG